MRPGISLILLLGLAIPAKADFVVLNPTASSGADAITNQLGSTSYVSMSNSVGMGQGISQAHSIVSYATFDLSAIQNSLISLSLSGSLSSLSSVLGVPYVNEYAMLRGNVTLPGSGSLSLTDPQAVYQAVVNGSNTGSFAVDNGAILGLTNPLGSTFTVPIDLSAVASSGMLDVGFSPGSASPFSPGVKGTLSVQLLAQIVPEPTAFGLTALGLGFGLLASGRLRFRRAADRQARAWKSRR